MDNGAPIRSISRSLALLQAINRAGPLTMQEAAEAADLPPPLAARILQALVEEGLVEQESSRRRFRATAMVQTLSSGFPADDRLVRTARRPMIELTRRLNRPVAITSRAGLSMVVRDSTHDIASTACMDFYPGYTLPILECASGRVFLAFSSPQVQAEILCAANATAGRGASQLAAFESPDFLRGIRDAGYASYGQGFRGAVGGLASSIAAPLFGDGHLLGAITLTYSSAMLTPDAAVAAYLDLLQQTAAQISARLDDAEDDRIDGE
jgi:IclR family mhp operon transcriptional activator